MTQIKKGDVESRMHQVIGVLALGCVPAWFSDGFRGYLPAILGHYGVWTQPERRQA